MLEKVTLENRHVRLEPLNELHIDGLWAASTPDIWTYMPVRVNQREDMEKFVGYADNIFEQGQGLAFAVMDPHSNQVIGATGFWNFVPENKRVEIGFTWYTSSRQRTATNTACKFLLLSHAFETLGLNRVEFKTDSLNERSRKAIARIGATEEGTLRNHVVQPDGRLRHSVYFSILNSEWHGIKLRLEEWLSR